MERGEREEERERKRREEEDSPLKAPHQVSAVPSWHLEGLSTEEKTEMITALKTKVSELYREVEGSEEAVLVLTKKNEILRRNMKVFRDGITVKINLLREQLHDKEEELAEALREGGAKPQSSREADLGMEGQIEVSELQFRLSRMEDQLQQREQEVQELLLASARPGRERAEAEEAAEEAAEKLLGAAQHKLVGAHRRAAEHEAVAQRLREELTNLRLKFAKQKARLHASGTIHSVMEAWIDLVMAARGPRGGGNSRSAAKSSGGGSQTSWGGGNDSWGQSPESSGKSERRKRDEGRASGMRQIEVSYMHRDIDRVGMTGSGGLGSSGRKQRSLQGAQV